MKRIYVFSLFMLLTTCMFGQNLKYANFKWDTIPFSFYRLEQYGSENTVILAAKNCIEYQYNPKGQKLEMFVTVHRKYLALTDKALDDVNKISISLSEESSIVEMNARFITQDGKVTEVYCEYDVDTKSGTPGSNRKVKSTINWVEINAALPAEIRLYDRLFTVEDPANADADFRDLLNPDSLKILKNCRVEPILANAKPLDNYQFLKSGYFTVDLDSTPEKLIFNRTVSLKDSWSKK